MKKILTSAFFTFTILTVTAGSNNSNSNSSNITTQATEFARQMINQVQLNESEYIQVRKCTIEKLQLVAQVQSMYSNDPEMMEKKLAEIENNYNFNLQRAMSPKQFESFVAYRAVANTGTTAVAEIKE